MLPWRFVGRERELARLSDGLDRGVGHVVIGPSGVGKTALAWELARSLEGSQRRVVRLVGSGAVTFPMQAFAHLLPDGLEALDDGRRLQHLQRALRPDPDDPLVTLLVVDDAHRLDEASGDTLVRLAATASAVVVATALGDEPPPPWVTRLWSGGSCERLDLAPFTLTEVRAALEQELGGPVDPSAVRALAELTAGNALALRELVLGSLADEVLVERRGVWALDGEPSIGPGVRDLVDARLRDLPPPLRRGLDLVALGEPLPLRAAQVVVGVDTLEALEDRRVIAVIDAANGPVVTMGHPLWGQVVRDAMPRLRVRRLHLDLARELDGGGGADPGDVVRSALWRLDAGAAADPKALASAAAAARPISLVTAETLARAAVDADPSVESATLLASILTSGGRSDEAAEVLDALPSAALDPADRELVLFMQSVGKGLLGGDPKAGIAMLDEPGSSARLRGMQSSLLLLDGRVADARAAAAAVLDEPTADGSARTVAGIGMVGSLFYLGRFTDLRGRYEVAERDASGEVAANPHGIGQIQVNAFPALAESGALDEAEQLAQARFDACIAGDGWDRSRWAYSLGRVRLLRGDIDGAVDQLQIAGATPAPFDLPFHPYNMSFLARALAGAGRVDAARRALDDTSDDLPRFRLFEPEWELAEAAILAAEGRLGAAAERAAWAAELATVRGLWTVALIAAHDAARYGGASLVARLAADAAAQVDGDLPARRADLVAALAVEDADGLDRAGEGFESLGLFLFAAEAAAEAARLHQIGGRSGPAAQSRARHLNRMPRCPGAVCPWLAGTAAPQALTPREQEVAILAAVGRRDADLAAELGISVRTVQTHLGRVYVKLAIHSREELAEALLPGPVGSGPGGPT